MGWLPVVRLAGQVTGPVVWQALDDLPPDTSVFGGDAFSTVGWYRTVAATAVPAAARTVFLRAEEGGRTVAIFPLLDRKEGRQSLTTPYSCLWHPLLEPGLDDADLHMLGEQFGRLCRTHAVTRLEALAADAPWLAPLIAGVERAGLRPLWFDHFGNWYCDTAGVSWAEYLARRPGKLRETIRRRTRRLIDSEAAVFEIVDGAAGLDRGLDAYARVYAGSWKEPEPFPQFIPALMRACAADGTLRLGLLSRAGEPLAAQFWIVRDGWAGVQKLAHLERAKNLAPGTVLTGLMIRHLLDTEHVRAIDFGRGDDAYKQDWTGMRRQRRGVLLANPLRLSGLTAIGRHAAGRLFRAGR
jgi:hypothetical protein